MLSGKKYIKKIFSMLKSFSKKLVQKKLKKQFEKKIVSTVKIDLFSIRIIYRYNDPEKKVYSDSGILTKMCNKFALYLHKKSEHFLPLYIPLLKIVADKVSTKDIRLKVLTLKCTNVQLR